MKIEIRQNVIYETFHNNKDMMEKILNMIINSKTDKILFKGNPYNIDFKTMKKILFKNYNEKINPDNVKKMYNDIIDCDCKRTFCIIYKEK
jgi:hypothetical protein